jgi:hypothetical protein
MRNRERRTPDEHPHERQPPHEHGQSPAPKPGHCRIGRNDPETLVIRGQQHIAGGDRDLDSDIDDQKA